MKNFQEFCILLPLAHDLNYILSGNFAEIQIQFEAFEVVKQEKPTAECNLADRRF
ncbi:MAG: hypothetical protein AAGU18_07990 [Proteiniphilum sp.]